MKERIAFIDLAKGVCILLVVLGHLVPVFNESLTFVFCFRMPLYFCLSGLFFKDYGGFRNFTLRKTNKILIPFVAWYLISYAIYHIGHSFSSNEALFHISDIFTTNSIFNIPIWFLLCLFWSNVIFYGVKLFCRNEYQVGIGILAVAAAGWGLMSLKVFNFLYLGSACTCMPYFYMGYALKRTAILYPVKRKAYIYRDLAIMIAALATGCLLAFIPETPPRFTYFTNEVKYGNAIQIYLCGASFVVGILLMCKFIGHIPFVSWLGRYSIIVLVTHMLVGTLSLGVIDRVLGPGVTMNVKYMVNFAVVVAAMLLIIPFCKKYLGHITAQKDIIGGSSCGKPCSLSK